MFNFGYPPKNWENWEGEVKAYWGARAIYEGGKYGYMIDLLPDRQTWENPNENPNGLEAWLNKTALPWLREFVKEHKPLTSERREMKLLDEQQFELRANTNGSFGYMYIGAIEKKGDG